MVYLVNVIAIMFVIASLTLTSFCLHPGYIYGRLSIDLTLFVTALGFKFALTAMLPPVGYVTVLDKYVLFCFMFMSLGTSIKAVYPHYYFNMTDTSVLYAKPHPELLR